MSQNQKVLVGVVGGIVGLLIILSIGLGVYRQSEKQRALSAVQELRQVFKPQLQMMERAKTMKPDPNTITEQHVNQLRKGMTYAQVVSVIGREGRKESEYNIGTKVQTSMKWEWHSDVLVKGGTSGSLRVNFTNGIVQDWGYNSF